MDAVVDKQPVVVGGVVAAISIVLTVSTEVVYDDPAILWRYAVNLAAGDGWVFNPGQEAANAVTSPLTVLLLSLLVLFGIAVDAASAVMFAVTTWVAGFFSYLALRAIGHHVAGIAAAVLVTTAPPLLVLRGMESSLYVSLLAVAIWCLATHRRLALGLALGMAVLARPDAGLFAVAAVGLVIMRERRIPWRTLGGAAGVVLPWAAVAVPLTGSLLPSTVAAKIAQERSGQWPGFLPGLQALPGTAGMERWFLVMLPLVAVGAVVVAAAKSRAQVLWPVMVATAGVVIAYGLALRVAYYPWYSALPVFTSLLLAALAAELLLTVRYLGHAVAVVGLVAVAVGLLGLPVMQGDRREQADVAAWLLTHSAPDATVAATEIGRLGLLSDRRMVDYLGLLDEQANNHVERQDWTWWVDARQPEFWVTSRTPWSVEDAVRAAPGFGTRYEIVFQTSSIYVYKRAG